MSELIKELESTTTELLTTIRLFNHEQFNQVPFEGSWTAGQVSQHVLLSVADLPRLLTGETEPTLRDPEAYIKMMRDMFLNFEHKMKSPPPIIPEQKSYNATELSTALEVALNGILAVVENEDLTVTCTEFQFPTIGALTRVEIINFVNVHTTRHTHQMKNIKRFV